MLSLADLAPTPIARIFVATHRGEGGAGLTIWVKRDDRVGSLYGGNKVRKLEHLLADAKARGARRLLTVGAAGSHQVVATALFGEVHGFEVEAVLVPQPSSPHARENLRVALDHGLRAVPVRAWAAAPFAVASRLAAARLRAEDVAFIPLGGSNVLGSLGFASAARELARQIADGAMPEPDLVVVAMGSGGTAAGLAAGLAREGLHRTRVVGVAISHPVSALSLASRRLAFATARAIGLSRRASLAAAARIEVDGAFVGRGYGHVTAAGSRATELAAREGIVLDPAYTAKAFAAALARAEASPSSCVLFWHTLSTVPLPSTARRALTPAMERLFRPA